MAIAFVPFARFIFCLNLFAQFFTYMLQDDNQANMNATNHN